MSERPDRAAEEWAASDQAQPVLRRLARFIAYELYQYHNAEADFSEHKVIVSPFDTLVFAPADERLDIELPRLRNSLERSAEHAGMIAAFFDEIDLNDLEGRAEKTKYKTAQRLSVIMRDSLGQLARLLNGEDLDTEPTSVPRFDDEEVRLAEVYKMVKDLQQRWVPDANDLIHQEAQGILDFIAKR